MGFREASHMTDIYTEQNRAAGDAAQYKTTERRQFQWKSNKIICHNNIQF